MDKKTLRKNILKILVHVSDENYKHDCEYAGRMDSLCAYCWQEQMGHGKQSHDKDCIHVLAKTIMAELKKKEGKHE